MVSVLDVSDVLEDDSVVVLSELSAIFFPQAVTDSTSANANNTARLFFISALLLSFS